MLALDPPGTSPRWRLAWFAAVAFIAMFGVASFLIWNVTATSSWWAQDLYLLLDAGQRVAAGQPVYADPMYLYPPAAAVVAASVAWVDPFVSSLVYALVKVGLVVALVGHLTRRWPAWPRALAVIGVATCLPFVHDLMLGNANTLFVAAACVAIFAADRPRSGIALGVLTALFAKPLLLPMVLLVIVRRRRTAIGTVGSAGAVTLFGVLVTGPAAYLTWLDALRAGARFAAPFAGNHGLTAVAPELWLPVAAVVGIGTLAIVVFGSWETAVTWAVASGVLLAPYAGTVAALPILLALPLLGPSMPAFVLAIAALSPVGTTYLLPLFVMLVLLGSLRLVGRRSHA
jgi:hypothetical protein